MKLAQKVAYGVAAMGVFAGALTVVARPMDDKPASPQASPAKPFEALAPMVGEWTTVSRIYMPGAAKPMEASGKSTFSRTCGGRFIRQDFSGEMMGKPVEGLGLLGFDENRNHYTMMWADSWASNIFTMHGAMDKGGAAVVMFGQMDEPQTKEVGRTVKWIVRLPKDDRAVFEAWEVECETPVKVFEVEYTRKR